MSNPDDSLTQEQLSNINFLKHLPLEIRVHIYKYLPIYDRLQIRQTCRQIKQEMDEHLNFRVKIDQSYRCFRRLTRLRIISCTIVRLTQKHLPKVGFFKYPHLIKKLIFDGNISIPNLHLILRQCLQVEHLVFTHETLGIENLLTDLKILKNLKQVTHINLQLLRHPLPDPTSNRIDNILAFLCSTFPKLVSFKLYFSVWGQWVHLFQFLQRHAENLTELELQVGDRCDTRNTQFYFRLNPSANTELLAKIDMKQLRRLKLKQFHFRDDVLCLNSTVSNIFIQILKEQKELEELQFHSPGDISLHHLKTLVRANEKTLEELVVYNLKNEQIINLAPPPVSNLVIDMTMFSQCKRMRTLGLSCLTSNRIDTVLPIKMIHLDAVPPSIERLHTVGFTFLADDIINLSRQSINLKEIFISDAGNMKYSSVISNILRNCMELEYISIRHVVPMGSSDTAWFSEVNALKELYSRFMGITYDPTDVLEGFEARPNASDRLWIHEYMTPTTQEVIPIPNQTSPYHPKC